MATASAILMPDLSTELIAWERPDHDPVIDAGTLDRVVRGMARLHALPWSESLTRPLGREAAPAPPWCPLAARLRLLLAASAAALRGRRQPGRRALPRRLGRLRPRGAGRGDGPRRPARRRTRRPLARGPRRRCRIGGLHGDLKLANVALLADDRDRLHRLADDAAGAGRGRARLVPRVEQRLAADRARRRSSRRYAEALRWDAGRWGVGGTPHDFDGTGRRLGGAGRPDLDRRPAAARLAQGPRRRGRRDPGVGCLGARTTWPGGAGPRSTRRSAASRRTVRARSRSERRGRVAGRRPGRRRRPTTMTPARTAKSLHIGQPGQDDRGSR